MEMPSVWALIYFLGTAPFLALLIPSHLFHWLSPFFYGTPCLCFVPRSVKNVFFWNSSSPHTWERLHFTTHPSFFLTVEFFYPPPSPPIPTRHLKKTLPTKSSPFFLTPTLPRARQFGASQCLTFLLRFGSFPVGDLLVCLHPKQLMSKWFFIFFFFVPCGPPFFFLVFLTFYSSWGSSESWFFVPAPRPCSWNLGILRRVFLCVRLGDLDRHLIF